jgi:hypothetical protein
MNTGLQDAANLGWKLAADLQGWARPGLLDSYHAERHPAEARVLKYSMAQSVTQRADPRIGALADMASDLLSIDEARKRMAGLISGLDVRYDLGDGHPLLGRRMPDLDLVTANGPLRVYTLLHDARAALLNLGEPGSVDVGTWRDRVQLVDASYDGTWELPVVGAVPPPAAVLIRPDGHVAWVGDGTASGLEEALTRWFGPPPALDQAQAGA